MTKAEEAALKRFPEEMTRIPYQDLIEDLGGKEYVDFNSMPRGYFQLGYEQAEKDIIAIIKDYVEKGIRCMEKSDKFQMHTFWDGFHNCAENILRELENNDSRRQSYD